jgi:hypothetical protein
MNQPTHAWLAVEAYRKVAAKAATADGKKQKLDGLKEILGANLGDVVIASWLPDALIKDMMPGHVFKNSHYDGDQKKRFILSRKELEDHLPKDTRIPKAAFGMVPAEWWSKPYRVKDGGGHLPARVNALSQTVRDMIKMGDAEVVKASGVKPEGAVNIAKSLLYSPRDIAVMLWMMSHYIADAHMPFHCDNRALAASKPQKNHKAVEDRWGEQVPEIFHANKILKMDAADILGATPPPGSKFAGIDFGKDIGLLKNGGDPWKEAVYICRASFAASFALVPPAVAPVDDGNTNVCMDDIMGNKCCGEKCFWEISEAIMADAVNAIARFWQDAWVEATKKKSKAAATD